MGEKKEKKCSSQSFPTGFQYLISVADDALHVIGLHVIAIVFTCMLACDHVFQKCNGSVLYIHPNGLCRKDVTLCSSSLESFTIHYQSCITVVITACLLHAEAWRQHLLPVSNTLSISTIFGMKEGGKALGNFLAVSQHGSAKLHPNHASS